MSDKQAESLIAFAHMLAHASEYILQSYQDEEFEAVSKSDLSPVTQADRDVESALRAMIEQQFPSHGIIGEEFGEIRPESSYHWVLDPIDGTKAFMAGFPTFTTLIGLVKDGVPILGVINQPFLGERWIGYAGKRSVLNHEAIYTRKIAVLEQALLTTTSSFYFTAEQARQFENLRARSAHCLLGGDAYAYASLAKGRIDLVVDAGMKPYDYIALRPIIEGAGGVITDWRGQPLNLQSDGTVLAAANAGLHAQALSLLNGQA